MNDSRAKSKRTIASYLLKRLAEIGLVVLSLSLVWGMLEIVHRFGLIKPAVQWIKELVVVEALTPGLHVAMEGVYAEDGSLAPVNLGCLGEGGYEAFRGGEGGQRLEQLFQRDEHRTRVLVIGDSYTKGHGIVDFAKTYVGIMNHQVGDKANFLSLSHCGFTAWEEEAVLLELGWRYRPNVLLLQYTLNDIIPPRPYPHKGRMSSLDVKELLRKEYLESRLFFRLLTYASRDGFVSPLLRDFARSYIDEELNRNYLRYLYSNPDCVQLVERAYSTFARYGKEHGIPVYVAIFPNFQLTPNWRNYYEFDIIDQVSALLTEKGVRVINLYETFKDYQPQGLRFIDDGHPNQLAHALAADCILQHLQAEGVVP